MNLQRRLALIGAAVASASAVLPAFAQQTPPSWTWPTRPVRFVVPSPAGTAPDIAARIVGDRLSKMWGQSVIVENRAGAGGLVAFTAMKGIEKDEYQFAFVPASSVTLSAYMYKSNNVSITKDLTPVAFIGESPMVLAVSDSSPYNTLADLLAAGKKNPDTIVVASPLEYSVPHLTTTMLSKVTGSQLRSIPFAGSTQAAAAVVGGDAQVVIDGLAPLDAMVKGKRLKVLATFSAKRMSTQPDWPAVSETYPDMVVNGWFGVFAMTGMNPKIIDKVNRDVSAVIVQPDVMAQFAQLALFSRPLSTPAFTDYVASERTRWGNALHDVGAQPVVQQ